MPQLDFWEFLSNLHVLVVTNTGFKLSFLSGLISSIWSVHSFVCVCVCSIQQINNFSFPQVNCIVLIQCIWMSDILDLQCYLVIRTSRLSHWPPVPTVLGLLAVNCFPSPHQTLLWLFQVVIYCLTCYLVLPCPTVLQSDFLSIYQTVVYIEEVTETLNSLFSLSATSINGREGKWREDNLVSALHCEWCLWF